MQVVAITGKKEYAIVERPEPEIKDTFVKVKIYSAPMCREVQDYLDGQLSDSLGHEAAGEVVEIAQPGSVAVGDRVVVMPGFACGKCEFCRSGEHIHCQNTVDPYAICNTTTGKGTYAQYCIKQDWLLIPIPEDISYDHASMACCGLGPTLNAMQKMHVDAFDTVLISGLGPVGLGAVINARVRGARVIGIDRNAYRADLAKALGAHAVLSPQDPDLLQQVRALTNGHGVDKSIETSSAENAPGQLVEATKPRGQLALVGWGGPILARKIVGKGLTVHGLWHWNHFQDIEPMWKTIRRASSLLNQMITHSFPMSQVNQAWDLQLSRQCGKIILHPWEVS